MSGRGTVWSFVVPHPPLLPAYQALAPYNVVVVTLEEDPTIRMVGNLVASPDGPIDEIGTINLVTPYVRRRAAGCIKTGKAFSLALPLDTVQGVQTGAMPLRINPNPIWLWSESKYIRVFRMDKKVPVRERRFRSAVARR